LEKVLAGLKYIVNLTRDERQEPEQRLRVLD
jgi:hypothetical protein